ncbi:MAG: hypothetical protein QNJ13_13600 [Paracoccaceae bacterium]|nr:hypothetical protein [Paracoccaceae bacterium]
MTPSPKTAVLALSLALAGAGSAAAFPLASTTVAMRSDTAGPESAFVQNNLDKVFSISRDGARLTVASTAPAFRASRQRYRVAEESGGGLVATARRGLRDVTRYRLDIGPPGDRCAREARLTIRSQHRALDPTENLWMLRCRPAG